MLNNIDFFQIETFDAIQQNKFDFFDIIYQ